MGLFCDFSSVSSTLGTNGTFKGVQAIIEGFVLTYPLFPPDPPSRPSAFRSSILHKGINSGPSSCVPEELRLLPRSRHSPPFHPFPLRFARHILLPSSWGHAATSGEISGRTTIRIRILFSLPLFLESLFYSPQFIRLQAAPGNAHLMCPLDSPLLRHW